MTSMSTYYLDKVQASLDANEDLKALFKRPKIVKGLEALRQHYNKVYGENYFTEPLALKCQVEPASYMFYYERIEGGSHGTSFQFKLNVGQPGKCLNFVCFELTLYPFCCGMRQMNGFSYQNLISSLNPYMEEIVHTFVSTCVKLYMDQLGIVARRVMINFVETGRRNEYASASDEVTPKEKPTISYPYFHTWAMKQRKYRTQLMYNPNSGNVIHHAEVCL